jgi:valyl-tRNA synthetase
MIGVLTLDAKINDNAPAAYRGLDRFVARKRVVADLEAQGLLVETKKHKLMVPRCARTGQVIEPMLTDQWFVAMTKPGAGRQEHRPEGHRRGGLAARCASCPRTGSTPTTSG